MELEDEENAVLMGEAEIAVMITDGKVDYLIEAVKNMKDAPQDNSYEPEPLDYEALDALYAGIWVDNNNGLTMFIQPDEETEHGYLVVLQGTDREMSAAAHIEESGKLVYEKLAFNSVDAVASTGWFVPDGTLLIWGHDEAAGSFENITVFVKIGEL